MNDPVNHPKHYTSHPSGIEHIQVTEHMGFCLGNAVKYIWRADLKHDAIEDLKKAAWYLQREIAKREAALETDPYVRKFGGKNVALDTLCKVCGERYGAHYGARCRKEVDE